MKNLVELVREKAPEKYPETKQELMQAYQIEYGSVGARRGLPWKQHLVSDLLAQQGHTRQNTDAKEYTRLAKNLGKRFESRKSQGERSTTVGQYRQLGKTLNPRPYWPRGGFDVKVKVKVKISQKWEKKPRQFTIHAGPEGLSFDGQSTGLAHAEQFLHEPTMDELLDAYFPNGNIVEEYQTLDLQ